VIIVTHSSVLGVTKGLFPLGCCDHSYTQLLGVASLGAAVGGEDEFARTTAASSSLLKRF